jgi:hypothetical protein
LQRAKIGISVRRDILDNVIQDSNSRFAFCIICVFEHVVIVCVGVALAGHLCNGAIALFNNLV